MANTVNLTMPALSFNGVLPGIVFKRLGVEVHPSATRAVVVSSDSAVGGATYSDDTADGQALTFVTANDAAEGATCQIRLSVDETGEGDDLIVNLAVGPFKVTSTDVDVSGFRVTDIDPTA